MFLLFLAELSALNFKHTPDLLNITITGFNENLNQSYYRKTGTYTKYQHITIEENIVGILDSVFLGSTSLISVSLPSTLREIGSKAFYQCYQLKELRIPDGVTEIKLSTFQYCISLEYLEIPKSVTKIANMHTFYNCGSFKKFKVVGNKIFSTTNDGKFLIQEGNIALTCATETNLVIPDDIETLNDYFLNGRSKILSITFGKNLKHIKAAAFRRCSVEILNLPEGLISIGDIFIETSNVQKIVFPSTLTKISDNSLSNSINLVSVEVRGNCPALKKDENGVLFNSNKSAILFFPPSTPSLHIPAAITEINYALLRSNKNLTTLTVNETNEVYYAEDDVLYFANKTDLISGIGGKKSVTIIKECKNILANAFNLVDIEEIIFNGTSIVNISTTAFAQTPFLTSFEFREGLKKIERYCFLESSITSITMPSTLLYVGISAFKDNSHLTTANFSLCKRLFSFAESCFEGNKNLETIILPPNLNETSVRLLYKCSSLSSIQIPTTVVIILSGSFGYTNLSSIDFGVNHSLELIDVGAFAGTKFTRFKVPDSVEEIGPEAFASCSLLTGLEISESSNLKTIRGSVIMNCPSIESIWLPKSVTFLAPAALSRASSLITIEFDPNNTKYIAEGGVIYTLDYSTVVGCGGGVSTTVIHKKTSKIASSSFLGCQKLYNISFESGSLLESIGSSTFFGCTAITRLTLPSGLETIEDEAFSGCDRLELVEFGDPTEATNETKLSYIGNKAFYGCTDLEWITLPQSLTALGDSAFELCASLIRMDLPKSMTSVGSEIFKGCTKLKVLTMCFTADKTKVSDTALFGLPGTTVVYARSEFHGQTVGSRNVLAVLDESCLIPTPAFTQYVSETNNGVYASMVFLNMEA